MTDLMNPPTQPPTQPANQPPTQPANQPPALDSHGAPLAPPPAPPAPPASAPPASPSREPAPADRRRNPRLLTAVVVSALVGAAVSGGIVAVASHDDAAPAATASAIPAGSTATADNPIAALVAQATPSIVSIHDSVVQTDMFGQTAAGQAAGTGFVLTADGYIVTNNHVIDGATDITVDFSDGSNAAAKVVAADPNSDLAVLKVDQTGLTPIELGSSSSLQVGDQLVAVGNALDLSGGQTVTSGIVSATGRSLTEPNGVQLVNLIQTDTAINPGNSGGPLLNMSGQVVGINTAIAGSGAQNVGFAIAIDPAKQLIDDLQKGQVPVHALLGVSTQPQQDGHGVAVVQVTNGSAADDAGLRAGDVITSIDDATMATPDNLATAIAEHQPGDKVQVTYERNGKPSTVTVTLGTRAEQH